MKNIYIIIIVLIEIFCVKTSLAQVTFQKKYSIEGSVVHQTRDGNYITSGGIVPDSSFACLIKLNPNGDTIWTKKYGNDTLALVDYYYSEQTTDGGYILSGDIRYPNFNHNYCCVIKTDSLGNELWSTTFGNNNGGGTAHQIADGGYIAITGNQLVKISATGTVLWSKSFYWSSNYTYSVLQTPDSGFILLLGTDGLDLAEGPFLIKTDSLGNVQWAKGYENAPAYSMIITSDGGFLLVGSGYTNVAPYSEFVTLLKTDNTGNIAWSKKFQGPKKNYIGQNVIQTSDNGFIITGEIDNYNNAEIILMMKTDSFGNYLWSKGYGDTISTGGRTNQKSGYYTEQTTDGGYIISGLYNPSTTYPYLGLYFIKMDSNGNSGCNQLNFLMTDSTIVVSDSSVSPIISAGTNIFSIPIYSSNCSPTNTTVCLNLAGINELKKDNDIIIYPNPSEGIFQIRSENNRIQTLKVMNIIGEEILETKINDKQATIDMSGVAKGIYFVQITDEKKNEVNRKVIVE